MQGEAVGNMANPESGARPGLLGYSPRLDMIRDMETLGVHLPDGYAADSAF